MQSIGPVRNARSREPIPNLRSVPTAFHFSERNPRRTQLVPPRLSLPLWVPCWSLHRFRAQQPLTLVERSPNETVSVTHTASVTGTCFVIVLVASEASRRRISPVVRRDSSSLNHSELLQQYLCNGFGVDGIPRSRTTRVPIRGTVRRPHPFRTPSHPFLSVFVCPTQSVVFALSFDRLAVSVPRRSR